ncbi:MAG TPA: hypothetical protein PKK80_04080, partial [Bacilli bacterium]|nr:hypothetical protein [Bacilli bacterium]
SNMTATPATITAATAITITATAIKGTSDIAKVTLFNGDTVVTTITSNSYDFDNIIEVLIKISETTTFKMVIEDSEGVVGNTVTATVTLNS